MATCKVITELTWEALRNNYRIGTVKIGGKNIEVNELNEAIEDGTLDATMQKCADELHEGDLYSALLAFSRNLSSKATNMKKSTYSTTTKVDKIMYELLRDYTDKKMAEVKGSARSGNSKSYWQYTKEEIEAADSLQLITSIYNLMASMKSKYPELVAKVPDFEERKALVSKKKSEMLKALKNPANTVGDTLMTKLAGGKKTTLSAEEAATLANLLAKLKDNQ